MKNTVHTMWGTRRRSELTACCCRLCNGESGLYWCDYQPKLYDMCFFLKVYFPLVRKENRHMSKTSLRDRPARWLPRPWASDLWGVIRHHWNNWKYGAVILRFSTHGGIYLKTFHTFGINCQLICPTCSRLRNFEEHRLKEHQIISLPVVLTFNFTAGDHSEDVSICGKIILKWIYKKWDWGGGEVWTELLWQRIGIGCGHLWMWMR
jgi:hypothetical protein